VSIKNRYIVLLVIFAAILFFINETNSFYSDLDSAKRQTFSENKKVLDSVIKSEQDKLKAIALQISLDTDVQEAYLNNNPQKIRDKYTKLWKKLRSEKSIYELHLFKPPSISFVNFSDFESLGRDTKKSRSDMFWVLSSFKDSSHLLICRTYPGIRATYPIIYSGKILGGVSAGKEIDTIAQILNGGFDKQSIIAYNKSSFVDMKPKSKASFLEDKKTYQNYYIYDELDLLSKNELQSLEFKEGSFDIKLDGKNYFVTSYKLNDFHLNSIGYVMMFNDMSEFYTNFYKKEMYNIIFFILGLLLAYFYVSRNVKQIVKTMNSLTKLTDRFRSRDFSDVDGFDKVEAEKYESKNELSKLDNNIKLMGAHLRDHYEELESEVKSKTKELQEKNALLKDANRKLKDRFFVDPLTELPNINGLVRDIVDFNKPVLGIIKLVNQNSIKALYGIGAGEFILQEIATFLKKSTVGKMKAYKIESNRFAILADEMTLNDFYKNIIKTTVYNIEHLSYFYKESEIEITADTLIGICDQKEHIIEKAEIALYDAKRNNMHYQIYSDSLDYIGFFEKNIEISKIIKSAIENDQVSVCYQPIVDANGDVTKYEALMRIIHEDRVLSPFEFLDFAKKTRYYHKLTMAVIKNSFELFKSKNIDFSINLSVQDINSPSVFAYITSMLENYPNPNNVWFEITESENIENIEAVVEFITTLRSYGVRIAIDDFWSGYSNFSYLLNLEPDIIKIDGSIIKNIDSDKKSYAISKAILSFAKTLNTKTVAEFVRSKEVFDKCVELGVDEFQGYYFSPPMTTIELMSKLESK
jgi:EAL domain-containing protein (putative c-di-GMP-specific phosphodiesterase class I)